MKLQKLLLVAVQRLLPTQATAIMGASAWVDRVTFIFRALMLLIMKLILSVQPTASVV
jgi:hypothetical protein